VRSLLTDALLLWVDGWAARSAGRRPGRRAARLRLAVSLATGGCERLSARTRLGGPRAPPLPPEEVNTALLNFLNEVDNGNHFAAWQEPNLFTEEIRAAFR
jgi:hypothetical protein